MLQPSRCGTAALGCRGAKLRYFPGRNLVCSAGIAHACDIPLSAFVAHAIEFFRTHQLLQLFEKLALFFANMSG